jgi:hypothetical protein
MFAMQRMSVGSLFLRSFALALAVMGLTSLRPAQGQAVIFNEVHTLAASTVGVPVEHSFNVTTAGTYQITLTDLGAALSPSAPLASVQLAVSSGDAIVGTPLSAAGTLSLPSLPVGTYEIHVVGTPGDGLGSGPIGIVVSGSGNTQVAAFQDVIALPNQSLPNGEAVIDDTFQVASTGSYSVTLTDLQLPQSLTTLELLLVQQGGTLPVTTLASAGSTTVTLNAGVTYSIFAVGQANSTVNAGLYSAAVTAGGGGAPSYSRVVAVGGTAPIGTATLAPGSDSFTLADLQYPAALSQVEAVLTTNGQVVAQLAAAGSQPFTASAGTYNVYAFGTAAASPGAGSYAVAVLPASGTALFSTARGVTAPGSNLLAYNFDLTLSASGAQVVTLTDFQFPAALSSLSLAAEQGGTTLGSGLTAAGTLTISPAAGPLSLVTFASPAAVGGLFGVDVAPTSGATVLSVTQAVGALFNVQQLTVATAGTYSVTATDLQFPVKFANYDTIVTQGATQLGSIYGGGTFTFIAPPGTYFLNFIAQPNTSAGAGTYALSVATAPAAPVVTLTLTNSQVTSGGTVDIIWSSQNATSCSASGGWTGTKALSGTATSAALTANTTFTLNCTGAGGSGSKSASVTVTAASGGGGGGAVDLQLLLVLAGLLLARTQPGRRAIR